MTLPLSPLAIAVVAVNVNITTSNSDFFMMMA